MADQDALKPLERCFGAPVHLSRMKHGYPLYRIVRVGRAGVEVAQALSVTATRKAQIKRALQRCSEAWQQGYTDHV